MLAAVAFLDAFQKVADMATNTRGRSTFRQSFDSRWGLKAVWPSGLSCVFRAFAQICVAIEQVPESKTTSEELVVPTYLLELTKNGL